MRLENGNKRFVRLGHVDVYDGCVPLTLTLIDALERTRNASDILDQTLFMLENDLLFLESCPSRLNVLINDAFLRLGPLRLNRHD